MLNKEYNYYNVDLGFFPKCLKLCFNNEQFQEILKDQKFENVDIKALQLGVAEVHYLERPDGRTKGIIIAVFNLDEMKDSIDEMVATIAHETVHIVDRITQYIGDEEQLSEETRAYLTESIVRQLFKACVIEKEKHAGKTLGTVLQKIDREIRGIKLQVEKHSDRSARQDSIPKRKSAPSGAKSKDGNSVAKANRRVPTTRKTRIHSNGSV